MGKKTVCAFAAAEKYIILWGETIMACMNCKTALVTGADRGFGLYIAQGLAKEGYRVYASRLLKDYTLLDDAAKENANIIPVWMDVSDEKDIEKVRDLIAEETGRLDILVSNAAHMGGPNPSEVGGTQPIDFEMLEKDFCINSMAGVVLTDRLLPLLEKGEDKRLFYTSSEISSLRLMTRVGSMRYAQTKTALNLGVRMLFNELRPKGYTFRLYQPGGMKRQMPDGTYAKTGSSVYPMDSAAEALRQILSDRIDEDRLALIDYHGRELSF